MKREGRHDKFMQAIKDLREATGEAYGAAHNAVMPEFDYEGAEREMEKYDEWWEQEEEERIRNEAEEAEEEQQVNDEIQKMKDEEAAEASLFMRAFSKLKDAVEIKAEMLWVLSHGAMLRAGRDPEKKVIRLTASDIGDAPSKAAVSTLQANVNRPQAFFDKYVSAKLPGFEAASKGGGGSGDGEEAGLDLDNLDDQSQLTSTLKSIGIEFSDQEV
jgi:hypothetical protein